MVRQWINQGVGWFERINLRERMLVFASLVLVLFVSFNTLLWDPASEEEKRLHQVLEQANQERGKIGRELAGMGKLFQIDPNSALKSRISAVTSEMERMQSQTQELTGSLISPEQMAHLLEEVLQREDGLILIELKNSTPDSHKRGDQNKREGPSDEDVQWLYQHKFTVELEGGFFSAVKYLEALEQLPWRFFWDAIEYEVTEYPNARIRIQLHTISLSEVWIGV